MSAHRNTGSGELFHQGSNLCATLKLYCGAASLLQEACCIIHCINIAGLIAHKGHITHYQRRAVATHNSLSMMNHFVHGYRHGGVIAQHNIAHGVAYEDHFHACFVHIACHSYIVSSNHNNGLALLLHLFNSCYSNIFRCHFFTSDKLVRYFPCLGLTLE